MYTGKDTIQDVILKYVITHLIIDDISKVLDSKEFKDIETRSILLGIEDIKINIDNLNNYVRNCGIYELTIYYYFKDKKVTKIIIHSDIRILNINLNILENHEDLNSYLDKNCMFNLIIDKDFDIKDEIIKFSFSDNITYLIDFSKYNKNLSLYTDGKIDIDFDYFFNLVVHNFDILNNQCYFVIDLGDIEYLDIKQLFFVISNIDYIMPHVKLFDMKLDIRAYYIPNQLEKLQELRELLKQTNPVKSKNKSLNLVVKGAINHKQNLIIILDDIIKDIEVYFNHVKKLYIS